MQRMPLFGRRKMRGEGGYRQRRLEMVFAAAQHSTGRARGASLAWVPAIPYLQMVARVASGRQRAHVEASREAGEPAVEPRAISASKAVFPALAACREVCRSPFSRKRRASAYAYRVSSLRMAKRRRGTARRKAMRWRWL